MTPRELVMQARRLSLDRLVVTDHNAIQGAPEAREIDPDLVIVGEEILAQQGELLAVFVQKHVPKGLPPQEAINRLREQGAFIIVPRVASAGSLEHRLAMV